MPSVLSREAVVASRSQAVALLGVGFALWAVATISFRFVGDVLFIPSAPGRVALVFALTVPLMAMISFAAYSLLDVVPERRLTAAVLLVLPGMLLDAAVLSWFDLVFTNLGTETGPTVAGVLLLAYATVLLTGLVPLRYADELPPMTSEPSTADESESVEESTTPDSAPAAPDDATRL